MNDKFYSIGAASRLLGLTPHALRKWEDRHRAVTPARSAGGDRRYTGAHLARLSRLKSLVDAGHAISDLAHLTDKELDELLAEAASLSAPERDTIDVAVVGERVAQEIRRAEARMPSIKVSAHSATADALRDSSADVIVIEFGFLGSDIRAELARIRATTGVERLAIVYGYGSIDAVEELCDSTTAVVRRPLQPYEFARTVSAMVGQRASATPELALPPHRFSREVLIQMAMISPELACECPRHVGQLLIELSDFEAYSARCEISKPQDAAIHNMLRRTAATSRALFEDALTELAEAEGIDLAGLDDPGAGQRWEEVG